MWMENSWNNHWLTQTGRSISPGDEKPAGWTLNNPSRASYGPQHTRLMESGPGLAA